MEARPPPSKWLLRIAAVLLPVAVVGMVLQRREPPGHRALLEDMNRLRTLGDLIVREAELEGRVPVDNGALDVYGVVLRFGAPEDQIVDWLHSDRRNMGPTLAEVRAGDYAHFPWLRARLLDRLPEGLGVALLWEPAPDAEGRLLVATSDHRVTITRSADELNRLMAR